MVNRVLIMILPVFLILAMAGAAQARGFNVTLFPLGPDLQVAYPFDGAEIFVEGSYARTSTSLNGEIVAARSETVLGGGGRFFFTSMGDVDLYATGGIGWLFPQGTDYDSGNRFHVGAAALLPLGSRWSLVGEAGLAGRTTRRDEGSLTRSQTVWNTYSGIGLRIEL